MIGREVERILNGAARYAQGRGQEYFTVETVLIGCLAETDVREVVEACGGDPDELLKDLEAYLEKEIPKTRPEVAAREPGEHPVATLGVQRLIQRSLFHVQSAGKDEVRPVDLLVSMYQAKDSFALYLLEKQGIERMDVIGYVSHGMPRDSEPMNSEPPPGLPDPNARDESSGESSRSGGASGGGEGVSKSPLEDYCTNLNQLAKKGKIDPLVGREHEIERVVQTLVRRRKNNPILVGEAGVGKTAIAEGLALRIIGEHVPEPLKNAVVYSLDIGSLLAGAKFRGDFEQRMKVLLAALEKRKARGEQPILFIDEIHAIIGAGSVSGGALDAASLLKPALSRGELKCIGSTTYQEFRNTFEKDHALSRRFQKVDIVEPTQEEAIQILQGLRSKFEEHHGVTYTQDALRAAVELSAKHLTDRFLPDKAIDVLDEAGARARLQKKIGEIPEISAHQIEAIIAKVARIPERTVNVDQKTRLKNLERDLKMTIFGQEQAINALVTSIQLARSGLRSGDKPVGNFLFCGPTGVGKTELSKQLGHSLGVPFLRFDMSEYMEKHTVSRLIGAPPGYVGYDQPGLLTDAVLKNPHSVVLLDEIEKAHPDLMNLLLQVMDHGTLTDAQGRKVDFRNTILIMTSNVGSRDMEKRSVGFNTDDATQGRAKASIEQYFSPEFRNRLDAMVMFNPLDPVTLGQVVGKGLAELESQLFAKAVEIEVEPDARELLAEQGYDKRMGARPLARVIQEKLKKPLAEEILFGKLEHGGKVRVTVKDKEFHFEITPKDTTNGGHGPKGSHSGRDLVRETQ